MRSLLAFQFVHSFDKHLLSAHCRHSAQQAWGTEMNKTQCAVWAFCALFLWAFLVLYDFYFSVWIK